MNRRTMLVESTVAMLAILGSRLRAAEALAADLPQGPESGSLFLAGGGDLSGLWSHFRDCVVGEHASLVVIPTALADDELGSPRQFDRIARTWQRRGFSSVAVLHTRDRERADEDEFVAPIASANAIWFTGGRQWRLADAYLGTRTAQAIRGVLTRGGVVGGTSAGATFLGDFLFRGDTQSNEILEGDHQQGLALLRGVAIDQHWLARARQADLAKLIRRHPHLAGIGIDEATAVVIEGKRFEVIGSSCVGVYSKSTIDRDPPYRRVQASIL